MISGVEREQGRAREAGGGGKAELGELTRGIAGHGGGFMYLGALEIGGAEAGRGVFDERRKSEAEGEQRGAGFGFGRGMTRTDEKRGAAGDGLRRGQAGLDALCTGGGIGGEDDGFFIRVGKKRRRPPAGSGLGTEHGVEGKIGDVQDRKHGTGRVFSAGV